MSDHDNILSEFTQITGADTTNARFFLESAAWNLEIALASFYETFGSTSDASPAAPVTEPPPPSRSPAMCDVLASCKAPRVSSRLGTMAGIRNEERQEDREAFYAGGSVHSGQQVLGPQMPDDDPRRRRDAIVSMLRAAAQEHGEETEESEPTRNQPGTFSGVGYRLGQTTDDSTVFTTDDGGGSSVERREVTLKLWKQGFCIEDGPLREYNDPRNLEFLNNIRSGKIPDELLSEARGGTVHLNMEDHRHELYILPKPKVKAFAGKGHVLGSPTPVIAVSDPGSSFPVPPGVEQEASTSQSQAAVEVNQQRPVTNIQVRLADGSRLHVQLNHSHTIGDLRRYIASARSQYANRPYTLLSTFPSRELNDDATTLEDAGILNSSILQRLTKM